MTTFVIIAAVILGLYMAWNIGANDVANAMGTSVGSGALTVKQAIILAGIFEFCGAVFVGGHVADTIRKGLVRMDALRASVESAPPRAPAASQPASRPAGGAIAALDKPRGGPEPIEPARVMLMMGMLSAMLAASLWLNLATFLGQPVSTTHAIIGAVVGFAVMAAGPGSVVWIELARIAASWVISPAVGGALAFVLYRLIQRYVLRNRHPVHMAKRAVPWGFGSVACILGLSVLCKVMHLDKWSVFRAVPLAVVFGLVVAVSARKIILRRSANLRYRQKDRYKVVEKWFSRIQPVNACYKAFAHGANDVANAIGPLAAVFFLARGGDLGERAPVPLWLLALGGAGIVLGLATYGYKVMESVGKKITEITPTRGFAAEFGTATTVLVCSMMGLPISTTFVLVGAVMGVGIARGFSAIDLKVIRRIFASWLVTIPIAAVFSAVIYKILMYFAT